MQWIYNSNWNSLNIDFSQHFAFIWTFWKLPRRTHWHIRDRSRSNHFLLTQKPDLAWFITVRSDSSAWTQIAIQNTELVKTVRWKVEALIWSWSWAIRCIIFEKLKCPDCIIEQIDSDENLTNHEPVTKHVMRHSRIQKSVIIDTRCLDPKLGFTSDRKQWWKSVHMKIPETII